MEEKIKSDIREFLKKYINSYDVKDDENIFTLGFINSLFAMQLVQFVEKAFKVVLCNDDLDLENFKTINALAALVGKKIH